MKLKSIIVLSGGVLAVIGIALFAIGVAGELAMALVLLGLVGLGFSVGGRAGAAS